MKLSAISDSGARQGSNPGPTVASHLAERLPALPLNAAMSAMVEACLSDDSHDWIVLLDDAERPVRLVQRAAILRAEGYEFRVDAIPVDATVGAMARTAVARSHAARLRPLACCDMQGRYCGLVRIERLLEALAESFTD